MAGVAYYNTGTATVAVNSKIVTGTGTNWLSVVGGLTAIKAGDKFGIHVGRPIIIASVDSNTQLTLEDNWPGPAQTNAAYKIELTSPDVIAVEALRRVLGSLSGGILYGVSQLTAAPNKALTIDENGAAALADLTTFGKSLIAALNSSAAYGALGVIPNAQLPTRIRETCTRVTTAGALDNIITSGWVSVASGDVITVNGPPSAGSGVCSTVLFDANAGAQTYYRVTNVAGGEKRWGRSKAGGTWTAWLEEPTQAFASNASNLISGEVADAVLPQSLKVAGMISGEVMASGFTQLNALSTTGFTKTQSGNNLVLTSTNTDPQIFLNLGGATAGSKARYVAFRYKRTAGTFDGNVYYSTAGHGYNGSYRKTWSREVVGQWNTVVLDMWDLTNGGTDWFDSSINIVRIDFVNASGVTVELAWVGAFSDRPAVYPQESVTDIRSGAPMIVGAFGLGAGSPVTLTSADNLNSLPSYTSFYRWASASQPVNSPGSITANAVMINQRWGSDAGAQAVFAIMGSGVPVALLRSQAGGNWTAWKRIDGSSDTVGDVVGPASSVDNGLAVYSGPTGKVLKAAPNSIVTNALLSNVPTATIKGRTAAGTGDVQDLTPAQARTIMDVAPTVARQVRLGAIAEFGTTAFEWNSAASGGFVTAMFLDGAWGVRNIRHRTVQQTDVSGNWVTVAQV
ncbi:hypothetical protein [Agrobacterium tumefaciens]|uniref:Minor tail protein n=1 Tax=Agrobacterium tumefaciens TaxID=358 RepID=A0AA44EZD5_AGRTU|nr:hypothetical protein [Agrobacterium tumefaciens]NSL22033.1 hypothetical protein [Agrobacterium tumefaciens]NTB85805.1 hypothetical protein [Agrobacterium tumefaciens]NTC19413.1 hypothetical protein [Agrobacterium tumefaciens]NTC26625.1 hypothetical protein [Agrobacterium tumefaciens]NTC57899.1 hypothetical protein [Agrobacterium tumefaciens]